MRLVIIGGSDAGISAALRARELAPETDVTVVVADAYPNFSICGPPFLHSGEVADRRTLAHRTAAEIEREGVRLLLDHTATAVFGRVYAAYGGVFIALSLLWGWCVDGWQPDRFDLIGAAICLLGGAVILLPRT